MEKDFVMYFFILAAIIFSVYIISLFRKRREGLTNNVRLSANMTGVATSAKAYRDNLTKMIVKMEDGMQADKYKNDYENIILAADDLVNNLMLQKVLNINPDDPGGDLANLVSLNQAKDALSNVMSYVDNYKK